ncbi:hypothetical protein K4G92_21815, partial [Mycobacterium tuberculosis]|nr:hypothetical protein [Mycobacterium tuberculosis]
GAGRISSSAGWRFAYPAYITIKFQKVNHHRRPAQAQRRRAAGDRTEFDEESGCRKAKTRLLGGFFK